MVVLLVFVTVLACIAVDFLLSRRRAPATEAETALARGRATMAPAAGERLYVPEDLYYHPGHAWVAIEGGDMVRAGADDLAWRLTADADEFTPPAVGRSVRQGMPIWSFTRNGRKVTMLAPVDGVVDEVNPVMLRKANGARTDPYGRDWVVRIRVAELGRNLKNLLHGPIVERWMEDALQRLQARFGASLGPVMADGGVLGDGIAAAFNDEEWVAVCREQFLSDPTE